MSIVAKSAFVGYTYQFQVALLSVFFLEENLFDINQVIPEIKAENHNFDDILCSRNSPNKNFYIQVKNYEKNQIIFDKDKVYFNSQEITTKQNAINIIVTRNTHNLDTNSESNGFRFYKNDNNDFIAIHLPSEVISEYIFSKFHSSRINQIFSFAMNKFTNYYDCKIDSSELPGLEFMTSDLLEKTFLIRKMDIEPANIFFIIGKPGVGKSHLVNELNVSEQRLYRFWVSNQDPDRINRLSYSSFLYQLSLKLFGSGRLKSEDEIINKLNAMNEIFYIDGLDHVENYNPSELPKYFDFLRKVYEKGNGRIIVLTRPLNYEIKYPSLQLQDWSFDETREYLNYRGITDYSVSMKIFKICKGYPIITGYLSSEWLKNNGTISLSEPISSLTEYYSIVLNNVKFKNKLSIFTLSSSFYLFDEIKYILDNNNDELLEFIKYYPFLFEIKNDRVVLIHDSFNNYINGQIQVESSIKSKLIDYVEASLMNEKPRFMSRVLSYNLSDSFLSSLLHKYCRIDIYIKLKNNILDYESVKQFYYSLRKIYAKVEVILLSPEEAYELSLIYTILMRDNVEQSYGLMYQYFTYLLRNKIDWKKEIFSSEAIYNAFSYFDGNDIDSLYSLETNKGYAKDSIAGLVERQLTYEVNFFKTYEIDNYEKYKYSVIHNNQFVASDSLTSMLVSAYLFDHDEDGIKSIVQEYLDEDDYKVSNKLISFLTDSGWKYTNPSSTNNIFEAKKIILQLGINPKDNDYINLTLKEIIQKNTSLGSFELNEIINGYLRLANHQNRKVDIQSITYYLPLYYEHKDYSIMGLSEIFYELIIRNKITLKFAFETIKVFQNMSDKGIRHLCNELVNLLGPNYVKDMEELGIFTLDSDHRVLITDLSVEVINSINKNYVESYICKIINRELEHRYQYREKIFLKFNEYRSILESKYSCFFKEKLILNSIELIDETQSLSTSKLEIIASETENASLKSRNRLDEGIVVFSDRDYYIQIELDYLTFSQCGGGWYEKLPYPDFLNLYDKKVLKDNIMVILKYIISKSFVGMKYDDNRIENGSDRGLMSGIPRLLSYVGYETDWNLVRNTLIKMIDVSLGKL